MNELLKDLGRNPETKWGKRLGYTLMALNTFGFLLIVAMLIVGAVRTIDGSFVFNGYPTPPLSNSIVFAGMITGAIWLIWNRLEKWYTRPDWTVEFTANTVTTYEHPQSGLFDTLHDELLNAQGLLDINDPEGARASITEVCNLMQQEITRLEQVARANALSASLEAMKRIPYPGEPTGDA